jgi:Tol biopolymer transport system component
LFRRAFFPKTASHFSERALAKEAAPRISAVFVARLDGSGARNRSRSPAFDGWPVRSPDGRSVLFAFKRGGVLLVGRIFAVGREGGDIRALTDAAWSTVQPSRAGDGRTLRACRNLAPATGGSSHVAKAMIALT